MKKRILRILAFPLAILLIPYSIIMWIINGKEQITTKLIDYSLIGKFYE